MRLRPIEITKEMRDHLALLCGHVGEVAATARKIVTAWDACAQEQADEAGTIEAARERYQSDDIEIDDYPAVSRGEDGAFVAAWVWVPEPHHPDCPATDGMGCHCNGTEMVDDAVD